MNGRIVVELEVLAQGEEAFEQVLKALRKELEELDHSLSGGLAAWTGDAKEAYEDAHAKWHAAANDMAESLEHLRNIIGEGHHNFRQSLSANLRMWHGA